MPPATASASAPATLAALAAISTVGTIACNLTLLSVRFDVGSRLAACRRRRSAHRGLRRAWTDIPIPRRRPPILIPVVPIAIPAVTVATPITIPAITAAPLDAPSIAVTATLTTLAAAGLAGMLAMTVAMPVATAGRAMS